MRTYKFPCRHLSYQEEDMQILDLDYIVSVGTANDFHYEGSSWRESHVEFTVYIKIGQPIVIRILSGTTGKCPSNFIRWANEERLKLIKAWENKDKTNPEESI
jgi:hypothetical protein